MNKHRIELLDSFRFIAIISVLLYHFTNGNTSLYHYGNFYNHIFSFGYLGVHFFFIISGFVISYTLENTQSLLSFYKNRFSRLFPAMLLCSLITFTIICTLDNHLLFKNAHEIKNLLPGLTFIHPGIWTLLTNIKFNWINGSYWTLWTEVQFYLISSAVYFLNKKQFVRNVLLTGIAVCLFKFIPMYLINNQSIFHGSSFSVFLNGWKYGVELFNITFFILWFLIGVVFYQLYKGFKFSQNIIIVIGSAVVLFLILLEMRLFITPSYPETLIGFFIMLVLFSLMIYSKKYLRFLENPLLKRIGLISYTIYLIHEQIGLLLIIKYGKYLGAWSALSPFIVIIIITIFAELSYRFYEKNAAMLLKRLFGKRSEAVK
jgi:peptidoglycan/LPS O-acetylase OafA/YrhL